MKELRFFLRLFAAERRWMIAGAVLMLTTLVASIALLSISGWFITAAALAGIAALPLNFFTPGASIRLFAILRTLSRYAERLVTHNATFRLLSRLRVWFFERAIPLAPARLGGYRSGDLLNRVTADIDALDNLYIRVLAPTVVALILGVLLLAAASLVAPVIAFAVLILLVLAGVGVPMLAGRLGAPLGREMVDISSDLRTRVVDGIQGLAELKVFQADRRHMAALADDTDRLLDRQRAMSRITGLSGALTMALTNLAVVAALYLGVDLLAADALTGPQLAMLTFGTMAAFEAVAALPIAYQYLGRTRAAARRLIDIADAAPTVTDPATPAPRPDHFDLVFDHVSFAYPTSDGTATATPAVEDINLTLAEGGRVAVLGTSGAGQVDACQPRLAFLDPPARRDPSGWNAADEAGGAGSLFNGGRAVAAHRAVQRHHPRQPPDCPPGRQRQRAVGCAGDGATGRVCPLDARWAGQLGGRVRRAPVRWPGTAGGTGARSPQGRAHPVAG